jgi:hypothetical protein
VQNLHIIALLFNTDMKFPNVPSVRGELLRQQPPIKVLIIILVSERKNHLAKAPSDDRWSISMVEQAKCKCKGLGFHYYELSSDFGMIS